MRLTYIIVFLVFHITSISLAQSDFRDGFIITSSSDTVFGLIDYAIPTSNSKFCFFREDDQIEIEKYTPDDILGFGYINNNQYVSKQIPFNGDTLNVFLEFLVNGKIDLYYFLRNGRDYYYMEKNNKMYQLDNKEIEINEGRGDYLAQNQKFLGRLKWLLSDSDISTSVIEKTQYSHSSLIKITKDYHYDVCSDEEACIVYYRPQRKVNNARLRLNCGVSAGSSFSSLKMNSITYDEGDKFAKFFEDGFLYHTYQTTETNSSFSEVKSSFIPGIFLNVSRNRNLSFQVELQYQILNYQHIKFENVIIPFSVNYDLLRFKKITPYLNLGTFININLETAFDGLYINYDDVVSIPFFSRPIVDDPENYPKTYSYSEELDDTLLESDAQSLNILCGAGMKIQLTKKTLLKFDVRYMNRSQKLVSHLENAPAAESSIVHRSINTILSLQYTIL